MPDESDSIGQWEIYPYKNFSNNSISDLNVCKFSGLYSVNDFTNLLEDQNCRKHSVAFTAFLCIVNFLILLCGFLGNSVVIYVVIHKVKKKTASTWFILNLAVADLLVILCCIPVTLIANIFTPWIFGNVMCKATAYAQGVSVFCSVYSLVAISFDRYRAIHQSSGVPTNLPTSKTLCIIVLIWILGAILTLPWAFVFQHVHTTRGDSQDNKLPFCYEMWETKSDEIVYFLLVHVFACFVLPLTLIVACTIAIWREVLRTDPDSTISSTTSLSVTGANTLHHDKKIRVLQMFTCLTFVFFICWLPLYLIMARVKFFYNENFSGYPWEKNLITILIPIAQLLGTCNSCVNPILYALLNQTFRESFKSIFLCSKFCYLPSQCEQVASRESQLRVLASSS